MSVPFGPEPNTTYQCCAIVSYSQTAHACLRRHDLVIIYRQTIGVVLIDWVADGFPNPWLILCLDVWLHIDRCQEMFKSDLDQI